ncbi:MAG: 50S ribosomal protein L25 [bacterium]|nr:50S ribosomal protein L25 [bacterium]
MARQLEINVTKRKITTKGALNKLRNEGNIPCVIYGKNIDSFAASINRKEFMHLAMSSLDEHVIYDLKVGNETPLHAIMNTRQFDALKQEISHIDFQIIDLSVPIDLVAEIKIEGLPAGVKKGGVMEVRTIKFKGSALPLKFPKYIPYDISELEIGDILRLKDITIPQGLTLYANLEESILTIALPKSQRSGGGESSDEDNEDVKEEK